MTYTTFSSRLVEESKRKDALAETYMPLCGMDVEIRNETVDVEVAVRGLSRLAIANSHLLDHRAERNQSHIAAGDNSMLLVIPREGDLSVFHKKQHGGIFKPGEMHLIPLDSPFVTENQGYLRVTGINLPGELLEQHLVNPEKVIGKTMRPVHQDAYQLLLGYIDAVHERGNDVSDEVSRLADLHIMDLVALTLGLDEESTEVSLTRGYTYARFMAMKKLIKEQMLDPELSAESIARHFSLSMPAMRKCFRQFDTTFTDFLNSIRLDWVYEQLLNPVNNRSSISTLAYRAGFNNLAWFNRAFKRKFGITPSEVAGFGRTDNM